MDATLTGLSRIAASTAYVQPALPPPSYQPAPYTYSPYAATPAPGIAEAYKARQSPYSKQVQEYAGYATGARMRLYSPYGYDAH